VETTGAPYLAAQYQRLRGRRGPAKAVTAIGHSILTAAWHRLQTGELFGDLGGDYVTRQNPDRTTKRLIRQLEALGHRVTLEASGGCRLTAISLQPRTEPPGSGQRLSRMVARVLS
jgi:hypothetical protein